VHTHFAAQPIEQPYGFPTIRPGQCLITRLKASSCFAFLQRLPTTDPSRFIQNRHLLWASIPLSTYQTWGSTGRGFAWPATFRLQGLVTLLAAYSPQALVGFVSRQQRLWDFALRSIPLSPGNSGRFHLDRTHVSFLSPVSPGTVTAQAGPTSRDFWVLTLARVPGAGEVIHHAGRWQLPWALVPSRAGHRKPDPRSPAGSSYVLGWLGGFESCPTSPHLRVSISSRSARWLAQTGRACLSGNPHRVFAPLLVLCVQAESNSGYVFTLRIP
jgi:hypothetical protein